MRARRIGMPRVRTRARLVVLLAALGASTAPLAGCDGRSSLGPGRIVTIGGTGPGARLASEVVGTWRRILLFVDDMGVPRSSTTTWQFQSAGTATRTVVARDLASGLSDAVIDGGSWRIEDTTLVVTFAPPTGGETRYAVRVSGDTLFLASQAYLRIQ